MVDCLTIVKTFLIGLMNSYPLTNVFLLALIAPNLNVNHDDGGIGVVGLECTLPPVPILEDRHDLEGGSPAPRSHPHQVGVHV